MSAHRNQFQNVRQAVEAAGKYETAWLKMTGWEGMLQIFLGLHIGEVLAMVTAFTASQGIYMQSDMYTYVTFILALVFCCVGMLVNDIVVMVTSKIAMRVWLSISLLATALDIACTTMSAIGLTILYNNCHLDLTCEFSGSSDAAYITTFVALWVALGLHVVVAIVKAMLLRYSFMEFKYTAPVVIKVALPAHNNSQ